jgi:hypothetical protein
MGWLYLVQMKRTVVTRDDSFAIEGATMPILHLVVTGIPCAVTVLYCDCNSDRDSVTLLRTSHVWHNGNTKCAQQRHDKSLMLLLRIGNSIHLNPSYLLNLRRCFTRIHCSEYSMIIGSKK